MLTDLFIVSISYVWLNLLRIKEILKCLRTILAHVYVDRQHPPQIHMAYACNTVFVSRTVTYVIHVLFIQFYLMVLGTLPDLISSHLR